MNNPNPCIFHATDSIKLSFGRNVIDQIDSLVVRVKEERVCMPVILRSSIPIVPFLTDPIQIETHTVTESRCRIPDVIHLQPILINGLNAILLNDRTRRHFPSGRARIIHGSSRQQSLACHSHRQPWQTRPAFLPVFSLYSYQD